MNSLRELIRGAAHLMDFFGVLGPQLPRNRTVEEDMAEAWTEVLAVVGPPPSAATIPDRQGED